MQLTQYVDSTRYTKHSYVILYELKQQNKRKKGACILLEQPSIKVYANLLVVLHSGLSNTFVSTTPFQASHREQQCFKYARTTRNITPDLATHAYMQVSCVKE